MCGRKSLLALQNPCEFLPSETSQGLQVLQPQRHANNSHTAYADFPALQA